MKQKIPARKPVICFVDGVEISFAAAKKRFSESSGIKSGTISSRLLGNTNCTSEWLTRPAVRGKPFSIVRNATIDGEQMTFAQATRRFKAPGVSINAVFKRLNLRPECTSEWLLQPVVKNQNRKAERKKTAPTEKKPVTHFEVNGALLTVDHALLVLESIVQKSDSPIVVTRSGNRLQTERERPNYVAGNAHVGKYLARHGIPGQPPLRQMIREDLFV